MKQIKLLLGFLLIIQTLKAQKIIPNQYVAIDMKALQLPDSLSKTTAGIAGYINSKFINEQDKVRAIFIWVAANIQYDIANMYAINFYESKEDKIDKVLATRKGVCENYAAVFNDVCLKTGIKSFVVEGYTKQAGFTDYIPHAWCAAFIDTAWFMFDATWGSGYVSNGKFYKRINNDYFKANPAALIKTHMPFDYLWQFLYYPITSQEFYEGKTMQNKSKPYFNFIDSIKVFEHQNHIEQLMASAKRIQENGIKNSMIFDRLQHIKIEIENDKIATENNRQKSIVTFYNIAAAAYNEAVNDFNDFINYRNHQFSPEKADGEIQQMIDTVNIKISEAKTNLGKIENPDADAASLISQLTKSITDLQSHVQEQQDWLKIYLSKTKSKRKSMFYEKKISWFGIPLN